MAGPTRIHLHDALRQVVDAAHARLVDATDSGGFLDGIQGVVKGERDEVRPDPPYLWVVAGAAEASHARSLHEQWDVSLLISSFVQSHQPEQGWLDAFEWAARGRSVVLEGRQLGLGFVEDVQSASLSPLGEVGAGRRFGAAARVTVRLAIVEPAT